LVFVDAVVSLPDTLRLFVLRPVATSRRHGVLAATFRAMRAGNE
jgi:hypothetical protein